MRRHRFDACQPAAVMHREDRPRHQRAEGAGQAGQRAGTGRRQRLPADADQVVEALASELGERIEVQPQAGGIHVLARIEAGQDDRALVAAAQAHGLGLQALGDWRMGRSDCGGLLMGFTNFATQDMAVAAVRRLRDVMDAA